MPYIGKSPSAGVRQRYQYTATAGQTTFSGTDLGNLTLTYTDNNFVDVFQNGVLLKGGGTDYTATSGTSVVLATGASVSDVIEIIVYDVFSVGNFFNRTDSDSRYYKHSLGEELILDADGDTSITADTDDQIDIKIAGADDFAFKANTFEVQTGSNIDMNGTELILDADADTSITADTDDQIDIKLGGSDSYHFKATAAHGNGIGIGTNAPLRQLHISNTSANSEIAFTAGTSGVSSILFGDGQTGTDIYRGYIQYQHNGDYMLFATSATERMRLGSTGSLNVAGVYNDTTSGGANVNVASDGHIRRSTSSRRYKNTIKDATHGLDDLLKLRSVTYKGNNDGDIVFGGLIAEEVHDAGLTEFVQYNDDGEPDALAYGNMVSLCIKAIQELSAKNDALEARIKKLEDG